MKKIALVTQDLAAEGGVGSMTEFLWHRLAQSGRYQPEIVALAIQVSDDSSPHLTKPRTWMSGVQIRTGEWRGLSYSHVGTVASEVEFQRYRPRNKLTELFHSFDLCQFVLGSPPLAATAITAGRPVFLWTATTTRQDRASQMMVGSRSRRAWSSLMVSLSRHYERRALKQADVVFALSEYTRRAVESIRGPENVVLAPCGVDADLFHPEPKGSGDYVVCVARFSDPRKNVRLLLGAYAALRQRVAQVPDLYLIGDPPSVASRQYLQNLGLADHVRLFGPKSGEELAVLYRNARFFVLSSNEEGLAIVILEAMASGLAVVSTDCGGPATAVTEGETGFLTPVGDVEAFSAAMERLVSDPALRQRLGEAGRRVVLERFSLAAAGKVFLDKYDEFFESRESRVESPESKTSTASLNAEFRMPTPGSRL